MELIAKSFDQLTTSELYEILRCRAQVFGIEQNIVYVDPDGLDQRSVHVFFAEHGRIAAYLRVIEPGVKYEAASIGRVLTLEPYRHRGLSRKLVIHAIDLALTMSDTIQIEAQAYLHDFYHSLGFVATSEPYILEGLEHIDMVLHR